MPCLFLIVTILAMPVYLQGEAESKREDITSPYLKWKPVEGATEYIVEIIGKGNRSVVTRRVYTNTLKVSLPRGEYRFRVGAVNKFKKVGSWTKWNSLVILTTPEPVFTGLSPDRAKTGVSNRKIILMGENIIRGAMVRVLRGDELLNVRDIQYKSDSEIHLTVQLDDAEKGTYNIEIINPGGKRTRANDVFIIEDSRQGPESATGAPFSYDVSMGYHLTMPVSRWSDVFEISMAGAHVTGDTRLSSIPVLKHIPFPANPGFLIEASYTMYNGKDRPSKVTVSMNQILGGGRIYYPVKIVKPVILKLSAGGGIAVSTFKKQGVYIESETYTSRDEYLVSGFSLMTPFSSSFFMEGGIDYMVTRYLDVHMQSIRFYANGGVRF